jgi:hypothetical protein
VAEKRTALERIGLTRGKAALIGVLAVVLVGVVYIQYGRSGDNVSAPREEMPAQASASPLASPPAHPSPTHAPQEKGVNPATLLALAIDPDRWKSPDLDVVVDYDPFALPELFPRPVVVATDPQTGKSQVAAKVAAADANALADAVAKLQGQMDELKQRGVHVIVREGDQYAALIGDRLLHVGDDINGFKVTAIEPDCVRIERNVQQ